MFIAEFTVGLFIAVQFLLFKSLFAFEATFTEVDIITFTQLSSSEERSHKQKNEVRKFMNCYPNFF